VRCDRRGRFDKIEEIKCVIDKDKEKNKNYTNL
jgi:hypothetical protein